MLWPKSLLVWRMHVYNWQNKNQCESWILERSKPLITTMPYTHVMRDSLVCAVRSTSFMSRDPFYKRVMSSSTKSYENTCWSVMWYDYQGRSQFCTCHDSGAVVRCATLCRNWRILITIEARRIFVRFQLWSQKLSVKWVPLISQWCNLMKIISKLMAILIFVYGQK